MHAKPIIFRHGVHASSDLNVFLDTHKVWKTVDLLQGQLRELFEIQHPRVDMQSTVATEQLFVFEKNYVAEDGRLTGDWIYYPWSGNLVHGVKESDYFSLRTNRNKNLIMLEEQEVLRNFSVGVVGLSVGSNIATTLAYSGFAQQLKLAEFDTLDTTNLNRVRARLDQVGGKKIDIAAEQIYEINPYAELSLYDQGLTEEALRDFVFSAPQPKIIFEIIDNFEMKIRLRLMAREAGIPVIMFSNLGDSILVDIERYDIHPDLPLFNGLIGDVPEKILHEPDITREQKNKYAVELVGIQNVPPRALETVREIGKTLVGRPQLAGTVTISGSLGAYYTRKIALGELKEGGRRLVKFDDCFSV